MAATPILVVDDSLTIRKLLEMALTGAGHQVQLAGTARDGVAFARRLRPRLILLDHILPDGKSTDVCNELAADPLTADIPIIIMSAKGDDIRPQFRDRVAVVACVAKPFSPPAILHVIHDVLSRQEHAPTAATQPTTTVVRKDATAALTRITTPNPPPASAPVSSPRADPPSASFRPSDPATAAAAQAIFTVLRERIGQIPAWLSELGTQPPAPFLARRLLTPDAVAKLLDVVTPLVVASRPMPPLAAPTPTPAPAPPAEATILAGSTALIDLPALIRLLADLGGTGVLTVGEDARAMDLYCDHGEIVMALPAHEESAIASAITLGWLIGAADHERAAAAGAPLLVMVAAQFAETAAGATSALHHLGLQALVTLCAAGPQSFRWRQVSTIPTLIKEYGRVITAEHLLLERLRQLDDWSQIESEVSSLDQVCVRAADLRARLKRVELTAAERTVLNLVDGRRQVRQLVERSRMSTFEVFHILFRLIRCGFVQLQAKVNSAAVIAESTGATVICAGSQSVLRTPLISALTAMGQPQPTVAVDHASAAEALAGSERPVAVVDVRACDALAVAQRVRSQLDISDATLIAITDAVDDESTLVAAGYDVVLTTPVHGDDLYHLLAT